MPDLHQRVGYRPHGMTPMSLPTGGLTSINLRDVEDDDKFFEELRMQVKKDEVKMRVCGTSYYDDIYPEGSPVKLLNDIIDPFEPVNLKKGMIVTVKNINYKPNNTWIICTDQHGGLWNVRPKDIEPVKVDLEKKGRFRILAMDTMIENQNKTQE